MMSCTVVGMGVGELVPAFLPASIDLLQLSVVRWQVGEAFGYVDMVEDP